MFFRESPYFDHMFATMLGIRDELMLLHIHDEVECFEWELTNQYRTLIWKFYNICRA